jgi:glycosyltransferase involved in cell wall biosynthesis
MFLSRFASSDVYERANVHVNAAPYLCSKLPHYSRVAGSTLSVQDNGMTELVTVCIPTYNGAPWIREAIASALAQTYESMEILIVDDASTDNTTRIVRRIRDSRIRLEVNRRRLGLVRNWNRCLQLSKGEFIKPLFQDDILYPKCVEYMHQSFAKSSRIGLVFALRDSLVCNVSGKWVVESSNIRNGFGRLQSANHGELMLRRWLRSGYRENWIGEPSSVMLRKSCLARTGLFNTKMWMCADFELWMRIMQYYDIGFVNVPLSAFRVHAQSATDVGLNLNLHWLDTTWLIEDLLISNFGCKYPELRRLRYTEYMHAMKYEIWRIRHRYRINPLYLIRSMADYALYMLALSCGLRPNIHESLTDTF